MRKMKEGTMRRSVFVWLCLWSTATLGVHAGNPFTKGVAPLPSKLRFGEVRERFSADGTCGPKKLRCAHGICENDACTCDSGYEGEACTKELECGGHGSLESDGSCSCKDGFTGATCKLGPCPKGCSGKGLCFHDAHHRPRCICMYGNRGDDCSQDGCPNQCSNNGDCIEISAGDGDETISLCRCRSGWRGQDCSQQGCAECVHGICKDKKCVCDAGYGKDDCSERLCPNDCSKRGRCVDGLCACPAGWAGEDCSIPEDICPNGCNSRGRCTATGCECLLPFGGKDCSLECPRGCSDRGACEHGVCRCLEGYAAPDCAQRSCPHNCNEPHGRCDNGQCLCTSPWVGEACEIASCPNECSNHGKCIKGACDCDRPPFPPTDKTSWTNGYEGVDCSRRSCPANCTSPARGTCDFATGVCTCQSAITGSDCSKDVCTDTCSGHGHCPDVQTGCKCESGWKGTHCEVSYCVDGCNAHLAQGKCQNQTCICSPGFTGSDCSQKKCPTALPSNSELRFVPVPVPTGGFPAGADKDPDNLACTRNGFCVGGTCACHSGWMGKACHIKECLNECNSRGVCHMDGTCDCVDGWSGADCSEKATAKVTDNCPNNCSDHGICRNGTCYCEHGKFFGPDCSKVRIPCPEGCAANGVCDSATGICHCHQGRGGEDCAKQICAPSPDCLGQGDCVESPNQVFGQCMCHDGFAGPSCSDRTCDDPCSGKGACINGHCWCQPGFTGYKCSEEMCPEDCNAPHGKCTADGCVCEPGFVGRSCRKQVVFCKNDCNHHGTCNIVADITARPFGAKGVCSCMLGWGGDACENAFCEGGCNENRGWGKCISPNQCLCEGPYYGRHCDKVMCPKGCSGHGTCNGLRCSCFQKWAGPACDIPLSCPEGCEEHGICNGTKCVCDQGWAGPACNSEFCPNKCSNRGVCDTAIGICRCMAGFAGAACQHLTDPATCLFTCQTSCQSKAMQGAGGVPEAGESLPANVVQSEEACVAECAANRCVEVKLQNEEALLEQEKTLAAIIRARQFAKNTSQPIVGNTDTPNDHATSPIWW